jgi:hypothetical protein
MVETDTYESIESLSFLAELFEFTVSIKIASQVGLEYLSLNPVIPIRVGLGKADAEIRRLRVLLGCR